MDHPPTSVSTGTSDPPPRVSVIVPAYNAEATIASALASLTSQTCREFEIIVIDDGSDDATPDVVGQVAASSPVPLRLITSAHQGLAAARNLGIASSGCEFVGFVDADDIAEPTMFEALLSCADDTGADLVLCEYVAVDASNERVLWTYSEGAPALFGGSVDGHPGLLSATSGSACNKLIARTLFTVTGLEFPSGRDFEDLATIFRVMGEARRIEKVSQPLYRYRQGVGGSIMGARDDRYLQIFDALDTLNGHYMHAGRFEHLRADLERINFTHLISGRLDDVMRHGARTLRHRFIRRAFAHMDRYFPGWRHDDVVRAACGRRAKHAVCTNAALYTLYTDVRAEARS